MAGFGEKFPLKWEWSGSHEPLKNFYSFSISGMDEATLFKFGKCVDYVNPHQGKISH